MGWNRSQAKNVYTCSAKMTHDWFRMMSLAPSQKCPRNVEMKKRCQRFFGSDNFAISTLLAELLWSFLDKSEKEEATLPTSSSSFDLPIIQLLGWVRQVLYWINQFYLCTHAYSGILLTLSMPTLHRKTNSCRFYFMREFWENYRLFEHWVLENWKMKIRRRYKWHRKYKKRQG